MTFGLVSLSLKFSWQDDQLLFVRATDALRLCRDGGFESLPLQQATAHVDRLAPRHMAMLRTFLARLRNGRLPLDRLSNHDLLQWLRTSVKARDLVVLREGGGKTGDGDTSTRELRRLVREISAKTRQRLSFSGRQYRLVADADLGRLPDRDGYEVVGHDDAVRVLDGVAKQSGSDAAELPHLLGKARDKLTRDWRPPLRPDGLILLRRIIGRQAYNPDTGLALTPSQIKKLVNKTEWIEIEIVDQDGEPYQNRYCIQLPEGTSTEGSFDEQGLFANYDLDPGNCKLTLLDRKTLKGAAEEAPPEPPPEALPPEALPPPEPPSEFAVTVVDEIGEPVANVGLVFLHRTGKEARKTNSSGIAKYESVGVDAVKVKLDGPAALAKAMAPIWEARPATLPEEYLPVSDEVVVVTSRPAAIETSEGWPFSALELSAGESKTISVRPSPRHVTLVEVHDALFRTNSAVVLPEGEAVASNVDEHESMSSVGLFATVLRYNEEHEGKKLFIAGHADRASSEQFNQPLSEERGKAVLALLLGNRDDFINLCTNRNSEVDVTQIFDWTHNQYSFTCEPSRMDAAPSDTNYVLFRQSFNAWVDEGVAAGELDARGTKIGIQGRLRPDIWGAVFDLYEYGLRDELGEEAAGVADLRRKLVWVDDNRPSLGFSEFHPVDENRPDGMRSQDDRRVEIMMFDPGEEPELADAEADPQGTVLYDGVTYERTPIEPLLTAKPWQVAWEPATEPVSTGESRGMQVTALGLPAGTLATYQVFHRVDAGVPDVAFDTADVSLEGSTAAPFDQWYQPDLVTASPTLVTAFPKVDFQFVVEAGGRRKLSSWLPFADFVDVVFTYEDGTTPMSELPAHVHSAWGVLETTTTSEGRVRVDDLPPGGARVIMRDYWLAVGHSGNGALDPPSPPAADTSTTHSVVIDVVDDTGAAVDGESYRLVLADGSERTGTVTAGRIEETGISLDMCHLFFPNRGDEEWTLQAGAPPSAPADATSGDIE